MNFLQTHYDNSLSYTCVSAMFSEDIRLWAAPLPYDCDIAREILKKEMIRNFFYKVQWIWMKLVIQEKN